MADLAKVPAQVVPVEALNPALSSLNREPDPDIIEAEWVRRYPSRRAWQWRRALGLVGRIGAALVLTWGFYVIPPAAFPDPFQNWKNPVIIALLICFIGKTLLDTLFYDHYQP